MKILLIGDGSNYHNSLSVALCRLGHDVTVASAGSGWMSTHRNIDLSRSKGKVGGALLWLKLNTVLAQQLKGYDVVQICNPVFVSLLPHRVRSIFDKLRRDNGAVFLSAIGTDTPYVQACLAGKLRYNEFQAFGQPTPFALQHPERAEVWLSTPLSDHCKYVYDNIDGAVSALYEYYLALAGVLPTEKISYGGIAVQMPERQAAPLAADGKVRIMLACHQGREAEKGADQMLPVLKDLADANKDKVEFDFVQNVPFAKFRQVLDNADIVVDQLYSYTPATTALMAMARGKVVVSGAEAEYYDFIGEQKNKPIINVVPSKMDELRENLQTVIDDVSLLRKMGADGIEFVKKHNSDEVVARRFLDFWERRLK